MRGILTWGIVGVSVCFGLASPAHAVVPGQNDRLAWARGTASGKSQIVTIPCTAPACLPTPITSGDTTWDDEPAWNPLAAQIAFQRAPVCEETFCPDVWVMNSDGTSQQQLTTNGGTSANGAPTWSPDGTQIAFWTNRTGVDQIWVMNADGSNQHAITTGPCDLRPDWSPGGDKIAFQSCRDGDEEIYFVNSDGTNQTQLTGNAGPDTSPAWSPDGQRIAFSAQRSNNRDIYTIRPDGTGEIRVTSDPAPDDAPAWAADSARIAFVTSRTGGFDTDVWSMFPNGGNQAPYSEPNSESESGPDWGRTLPPGYARPKGATPIHASLVPAYQSCTSPDRTHGPPLVFGSCSSPDQGSSQLTVGTPDANGQPAKSTGYVRYDVLVGSPSTPADEADVHLEAGISDVRNSGSLADYPGALSVEVGLRVTDREVAGGATVSDASFAFDVPCAGTADTTVGSTCVANTSADAVLPGAVPEGLRSIWQLGRVEVLDGNDALFMTQGLFIP